MHNSFLFSVFLIFFGAALFATLALWTRQSLLVAYILLGVLMGPAMGLLEDPQVIQEIGDIGIIFLLFLLGLNLDPLSLIRTIRQTSLITLITSFVFAAVGFGISYLFGFNTSECMVIGICMMFSSTIIGLKLLPTTVLHHQRMGEIVISVLLLQDILAIFSLLVIEGAGQPEVPTYLELFRIFIGLPGLLLMGYLAQKFVLVPVLKYFNRIHEYMFLIAIGWCLTLGQLAEYVGLSFEIGAFIAGISLASCSVARFIAESLRPLRDFFLILFFFSLGAGIDLKEVPQITIPAIVLALAMLGLKPIVFKWSLSRLSGSSRKSWEIGVRMGQISEFSLLVAYKAVALGIISDKVSTLVQMATILSFMVSSYWILNRYPTPISLSERLQRD